MRSSRRVKAPAVDKPDERAVLARAKAILMQRYSLDEQTAYAMLRRIAMDRRMRMVEVARRIVDGA